MPLISNKYHAISHCLPLSCRLQPISIPRIEEMRLQQTQPDVISYNSAISACDKSGEWQAALHLFPVGSWGITP